ncbi:hypothetical protein [Chitinimonas sp. BJB300]|uniref:hypothetical protein n=1 Tax=Chitinimonas sp. BJB300 TaxID=1559339 RepID=UPI002692E22C|nr:hypothetical protein [Chitinimonas sp. BJB300]
MGIRRGYRCTQTNAKDARQAAQEFHAGVMQDEIELVLFFLLKPLRFGSTDR